eukprot:CAMPEP_0172520188 /NCGR_PEP_ID=MMETSP1066-20121228/291853_1 /TAXON_ID=671091 /ORGANISM="Coscinodiscus wailesii, Strain CCMP2513" /LENGTH=804 /DNA_ID=CAMNT_0013302907 /DNA_START=405 /DNA_END=2819 /DNA_ORIENTATION=-
MIRLCLWFEGSGLCSAAWIIARYQKVYIGLQPDEIYLNDAERHSAAPHTSRDKDIVLTMNTIKYIYSIALLTLSLAVVMTAMFTKQTSAAAMNIPPAAAFFIFWFLIFWLAMMEGGQGSLVGLHPIDKNRYAHSHKITAKCTHVAHKGDNLERFIIGRQFLVVLVVFVINLMGSAADGASVLNLPEWANELFLASGLAMILITIVLGQLTAQVNSANCMLDFINTYFMLFTVYVSLAIEMSGLLHSVYLVQLLFSKITGEPVQSNEAPRSTLMSILFWLRVLVSIAVLGFSFAVTLSAVVNKQTTMWEGVPVYVSIILFFALMCFVGIMEGMQIALFAVVKTPEEDLVQHSRAYESCQLAFAGSNLQSLLIGRQICVTICMFIIARITTLDIGENDENIFGVSDGMQVVFDTGLLGAVITTIVASLCWRIVASSFPVSFLSNPLIYAMIRLCLWFEGSGLCSAAWVIARYQKVYIGLQPDEIYLNDAERHSAAPHTSRDKDIVLTMNTIKYIYSIALLTLSLAVVMTAMFTKQTSAAAMNIPPAAAFFIFWFLIFWLAMMEGGQGSLVGLHPIDKNRYAHSHKITAKCTHVAHKGDNLERFIIGRQFLVVLVVFVINLMGSAADGASVLNLPEWANELFLASGLAMILITIVLGQLTAQVNSANCMLDFINTYFMLFTVYVSLAIEMSGLLHSVYLVQLLFSKITGEPVQSNEAPRSTLMSILFWLRVLVSIAVLGFSFAVTLSAVVNKQTTMWEGVPVYVSIILFFALMCFVGIMEGMQIALFAVVNTPCRREQSLRVLNRTA